jgi:hypothetical protein
LRRNGPIRPAGHKSGALKERAEKRNAQPKREGQEPQHQYVLCLLVMLASAAPSWANGPDNDSKLLGGNFHLYGTVWPSKIRTNTANMTPAPKIFSGRASAWCDHWGFARVCVADLGTVQWISRFRQRRWQRRIVGPMSMRPPSLRFVVPPRRGH